MPFEESIADEGGRDLPRVGSRARSRVLFGDDEHRGLEQVHDRGVGLPVADRFVDERARPRDLPNVPGADRPACERGADSGEVCVEGSRIREGELDGALRDVCGSRELRDHRPVDRVTVVGAGRDVGVVKGDLLHEQLCRFRFEDGYPASRIDPGIQDASSFLEFEVEIGRVCHASILEDTFEEG